MRCQLFVEVEIAIHCLSDTMKTSAISNYIPNFFSDVADLSATLLIDTTNSLFRRLPNGKKDTILSLEYLASRLSVSDITHPSDAVYPLYRNCEEHQPKCSYGKKAERPCFDISSKPFYVSYHQPYVDTCKDFVQFSIRQSEASRALDILCRP